MGRSDPRQHLEVDRAVASLEVSGVPAAEVLVHHQPLEVRHLAADQEQLADVVGMGVSAKSHRGKGAAKSYLEE